MYGISRLVIATAAIVGIFVVMLVYAVDENDRMVTYDVNFQGRDVEAGADLYYQACADCHGANGEGLVGPALNTAELLVAEPGQTKPQRLIEKIWLGDVRSYLESTIAGGRPGTVMPAWSASTGGPYRDDQITSLASFIMNWGLDPGQKWGGAPERVAIGGVSPAPIAGPQPIVEAPPRDVRSAALGRYLFEGPAACGDCHVFNGTAGTAGPDLTDVAERMGREYVRSSITNPEQFASEGHAAGAMPETFDFTMTDIEIDSIVDYLESPDAAGPAIEAGDGEPVDEGPPDGEKLAQSTGCIACHSIDGSVLVGPSWLGLAGSTREFEDGTTATADDTYLQTSIAGPASQIVAGFTNVMPANYGDLLDEAEIAAIIEYIKTLE